MRIAGFQKTSFVDFPGTVACVVFAPLCNMRCSFCHNKHILGDDAPKVEEFTVLDYLRKRSDVVKGVVITGGEPTLQPDLERFASVVKGMGFKVKLDTNGTNPKIVKDLCSRGYVDYVAMDLKAPIDKYPLVCRVNVDVKSVLETVAYLKESGISHEFRTTFCPELTKEDIVRISREIVGESDFYLQQYRQVEDGGAPHPPSLVEETAKTVVELGGKCVVRGL